MKTVCFLFVVVFVMEKFCASAQRYTVSKCRDGTLLLECRTGLIQVHDVVLSDSSCTGSSCCPRQDDCSGAPSFTYRNQVHNSCNGQQSCSMSVEIRNIGCSFLSPRNDYASITFSCIAIQTSPEPTILTTTFPTTLSSSSASTWQHLTPSRSIPINTPPYQFDDKKATEIEKEGTDMTTSHSTKLNPTHPQKQGEATSGSEKGMSASQVKTDQDKDNGYLDRVTTLVAVIVGGVVITATVISVAVVLVLKKRRIVKIEEEHYDMPNYSRNANNDGENVRNSKIYEFITDSGNCSASYSAIVDFTTKENDYLTPVMESEEAPYLGIII